MDQYPEREDNEHFSFKSGSQNYEIKIGGQLIRRGLRDIKTEQRLINEEKVWAEKFDTAVVTDDQNPCVSVLRLWKLSQMNADNSWDIQGKLNSKMLDDNLKAHFFLISATLQDVCTRFVQNESNLLEPGSDGERFKRFKIFAKRNRVVLTHPLQALLAPLELMRILQD